MKDLAWRCCFAFTAKPCLKACLLSAALKTLQLTMLSEVWILTKLTLLTFFSKVQEAAVGLNKLITLRKICDYNREKSVCHC